MVSIPNVFLFCKMLSNVWLNVVGCKTTPAGEDYKGTIYHTVSGRTCQRWDSQFPHKISLIDGSKFPEGNISAAENFCRNPDDSSSPWCYTTDPNKQREHCNIPQCGK